MSEQDSPIRVSSRVCRRKLKIPEVPLLGCVCCRVVQSPCRWCCPKRGSMMLSSCDLGLSLKVAIYMWWYCHRWTTYRVDDQQGWNSYENYVNGLHTTVRMCKTLWVCSRVQVNGCRWSGPFESLRMVAFPSLGSAWLKVGVMYLWCQSTDGCNLPDGEDRLPNASSTSMVYQWFCYHVMVLPSIPCRWKSLAVG